MKSEEDGTFITFEMPCGTFSFRNRKRKKNVEEALLSAIECTLIINLLFVSSNSGGWLGDCLQVQIMQIAILGTTKYIELEKNGLKNELWLYIVTHIIMDAADFHHFILIYLIDDSRNDYKHNFQNKKLEFINFFQNSPEIDEYCSFEQSNHKNPDINSDQNKMGICFDSQLHANDWNLCGCLLVTCYKSYFLQRIAVIWSLFIRVRNSDWTPNPNRTRTEPKNCWSRNEENEKLRSVWSKWFGFVGLVWMSSDGFGWIEPEFPYPWYFGSTIRTTSTNSNFSNIRVRCTSKLKKIASVENSANYTCIGLEFAM